jgi:hypothetical protein
MKRHRQPLRLQSGYWVADWKLKKDLEAMSSVLLGKLNYPPPIAAVPLVLCEQAIEIHLSTIMLTLNLTSCRQIASWAIEKGLSANT